MKELLLQTALDLQAVKINCKKPFRWASGYYMPIYTDNRIIIGSYQGRQLVTKLFTQAITENYDYIAGAATGGIAPAACLADVLEKPLIYVRSKSKDHGTENLIEGISASEDLTGKKIALIEDAVSTGGSSLACVAALRRHGAVVLNTYTVYSYGFEAAQKRFADAQVHLHPLFTYDDMIAFAEKNQYISTHDYELLRAWQKEPFEWGEKNGFRRSTG